MKDENGINDRGVSFSELMAAIENPDVPHKFPFNEYNIIGDKIEIYKIIYSSGYINIDADDVKSTLSKDAANYVSNGSAKGDGCVLNALKDALAKLPIGTEGIAKLLFHIWMPKNMDSAMKEFGLLVDYLNELQADIDVCWGCAHGDLLKEIKVSLIVVSK